MRQHLAKVFIFEEETRIHTKELIRRIRMLTYSTFYCTSLKVLLVILLFLLLFQFFLNWNNNSSPHLNNYSSKQCQSYSTFLNSFFCLSLKTLHNSSPWKDLKQTLLLAEKCKNFVILVADLFFTLIYKKKAWMIYAICGCKCVSSFTF